MPSSGSGNHRGGDEKISDVIRLKHTEIPWDDMAGMRDKLIHDYIDADLRDCLEDCGAGYSLSQKAA